MVGEASRSSDGYRFSSMRRARPFRGRLLNTCRLRITNSAKPPLTVGSRTPVVQPFRQKRDQKPPLGYADLKGRASSNVSGRAAARRGNRRRISDSAHTRCNRVVRLDMWDDSLFNHAVVHSPARSNHHGVALLCGSVFRSFKVRTPGRSWANCPCLLVRRRGWRRRQ